MKLTIVKGTSHELHIRYMIPDSDDFDLEAFDHTKLAAINTCPTWGITRYQMHLRMPGGGRALALEAGHALHECFSWIRLATFLNQQEERGKDKDYLNATLIYHGLRLFGEERLKHLSDQIKDAEDIPDMCRRGSIAILDTSGYYDDPRDKRRTLSNMEEAAYAYINRWRYDHSIWARDYNDLSSDVGIEIPFELHASISGPDYFKFRFVGRLDGICYDGNNRMVVDDNKTASRLSDAWTMAQVTQHQYTGYCVAASHFTQHAVDRCRVLGLALPQPKTYEYGGFASETMNRYDYHLQRWVDWLVHTLRIAKEYNRDPISAPKYTHSCNRYFRPCSLIPFCYGDDDEQNRILGEMEHEEWSPLQKGVLDGVGSE